MDKYIYDNNNGLWYELQGGYYIPCLTLPAEKERPVGIWGQRHKRYLKEHRKATYTSLLTSGKLNAYLANIDEQAEEMFSRLVEQMVAKQGITEQMEAENQMLWVGRMNNIRSAVMEIVLSELIYNSLSEGGMATAVPPPFNIVHTCVIEFSVEICHN